jgi:hypothetical protein
MSVSGVAGIRFVMVAVAVNLVHLCAGLPMPTARTMHDELTASFAAVGDASERPSVIPLSSRMLTAVFAAGLRAALWCGNAGIRARAVVGVAGVLTQTATFAYAQARRFGRIDAPLAGAV